MKFHMRFSRLYPWPDTTNGLGDSMPCNALPLELHSHRICASNDRQLQIRGMLLRDLKTRMVTGIFMHHCPTHLKDV